MSPAEHSMWQSIRSLRQTAAIYRRKGKREDVRRIHQFIRFTLARIRIERECHDRAA